MFAKRSFQPGSIVWRDISLTLKDGVSLISRCWHPKEGGPWPALLMRQPYGKSIASTITYAHPEWWASHGYLVIVQDVRGQGDSGGEFNGFCQEESDTTETHSWVRSLSECNGKIGTYGFSYQGFTQLLANPGTPPPDCLAPAMTGLDECSHWSCDGGAYWWHIGIAWGIQLAALKAKRDKKESDWLDMREALTSGSYLQHGEQILKTYDPKGMAIKWLTQSSEKINISQKHKPLKTWLKKPMFLIGGWWDPHLRGIFDLYNLSKNSGGNPEIHIGPATHLEWWQGTNQLQLEFFNKHLKKDGDTPNHKSLIKLWNITTERWETPKDLSKPSKPLGSVWSLSSDGLACASEEEGALLTAAKGSGGVTLVHDPWRPVPAVGGHLSEEPGLVDRRKIDLRMDVAKFTSKVLTKTLHLEGVPSLRIKAHSDQKGFDLCIALSAVDKKKEKVMQLSTGFLRVIGSKALEESFHQILLQPLRADLLTGQNLRLSIAPSSWPAIGVNNGSTNETFGAPRPSSNTITLSLNLEGSELLFLPFIF
ncbi:CocE/NonD family hydrolase [Prochlorococcus sp. MIT 1341]|uniref:CocE/NonD family hydrolase n=1 Tax=Prochlorococcus sp. MIT 1341 TaxID=3096221 RepID=UPI002A75AAB4|nr:CocE/NonD family hydrolase [Prochlorococcus sp. MIT 1341]